MRSGDQGQTAGNAFDGQFAVFAGALGAMVAGGGQFAGLIDAVNVTGSVMEGVERWEKANLIEEHSPHAHRQNGLRALLILPVRKSHLDQRIILQFGGRRRINVL